MFCQNLSTFSVGGARYSCYYTHTHPYTYKKM